jgi:O-antigen ligase
MRAITLHRFDPLVIPLVVVVLASVLVGVAGGMKWYNPLVYAGCIGLFLLLVSDIRMAVPLLIVGVPFGPRFAMSFGNLYFATALLIIALSAWIWRNSLLRVPFAFPRNRVLISLVVLCAVLGVSTMQRYTEILQDTPQLLRLIQFYLYAALFAMIFQMEFSRDEIRRLLVWFLMVGVAQGVLGLWQWIMHPGLYVEGTFDEMHNHFAIFCVFVALVLLGVILETRNKAAVLAGLTALAVLVFAIVFSFSRTGYVALAAGIAVFLFMPVPKRKRALLAVGAVVMLLVLYMMIPEAVRTRAYSIYTNVILREAAISYDTRLQLWREGLVGLLRQPVLGTGGWGPELTDNSYVKMLSQGGILSFAAFVALLYYILKAEWNALKRRVSDRLMKGILLGVFPATVACLLVYNFSGDFFGVHRFMGVFWIVLALVLKYTPADEMDVSSDGT